MFRPLLKVVVLIALLVSTISISPLTTVQACSGGTQDVIDDLLERTDYIVKAKPISIDAMRQNGVLQVESYLVGGAGPQYLLFVQNDPIVVDRMLEGSAYNYCDFFERDLQLGETGYFFLKRRPDGVYESTRGWQHPNFHVFAGTGDDAKFYVSSDSGRVGHLLNEAEFIDFIADQSGEKITSPNTASPYPLLSPLKIDVADGISYMLPVDGKPPIEVTPELLSAMTQATLKDDSAGWNALYFGVFPCPSVCEAISPDGLNFTYQDGELIRWLGGETVGEHALFSSTSDAIAIWNGNTLTVFTLGFLHPGYSTAQVTQLKSVTLEGTVNQMAAWSPDGRTLAYSDQHGLWLMGVYANSQPRLLLASENKVIPTARYFSSTGRYLAIQRGMTRNNIELESGTLYPDGYFSPDDRFLLAFDTSVTPYSLRICQFIPTFSCESVRETLINQPGAKSIFADQFTEVMWRDNYSFLVTACTADVPQHCFVDRRYYRGGLWYDSYYFSQGFAFDYESHSDYLAVVKDAKTILINDKVYDLGKYIKEPIVAVEWLPSLFYWR